MYSLNCGEIHEANSNAISLWAKVPPPRPDVERMPIAPVFSIHFCGESTKAFVPASLINWSNSTSLKFGLFSCSHVPTNSSVNRVRSQCFYNICWKLRIFMSCYVGQANKIIVCPDRQHSYISTLRSYLAFKGFSCHSGNLLFIFLII